MAKNVQQYELQTDGAKRALDELIQKAERLNQTLEKAASNMNGGGSSGEFRTNLRDLAATQGAIAGARSINASASVTGRTPGERTLMGGMEAGVKQALGMFSDIDGRLSPAAQLDIIRQSGITQMPVEMPFSARQFVQGLVQSVQSGPSYITGGTRQYAVSDLLPQAFARTQAFPGPVSAAPLDNLVERAGNFRGYGPLANVNARTLMSIGFGVNQAASTFAQYGDLYAQQVVTGHRDIMGQGALIGSTLGSLIGGAAGFMWGGGYLGGAFGMSAGGTVGGAVGRMLTAESEAQLRATVNLMGAGASRAALFGNYTPVPYNADRSGGLAGGANGPVVQTVIPPVLARALELSTWSQITSDTVKGIYGSNYQADYGPTREEVASAYNAVSAGMIEGGINPTMLFGSKSGPGPFPTMPARPGTLINSTIDVAQRMVQSQYGEYGQRVRSWGQAYREAGGPNEIGKWVVENLALRMGRSVEESAKSLQPIFAAMPETGGNMADMLMRFGISGTNLYNEAMTPFGSAPSVSIQELMGASSIYRSGARLGQFGATMARGSGAFMASAAGIQMQALAALPGGTDSLAYAQAKAQQRQYQSLQFEQESLPYRLHRLALDTQEQVLANQPFAPGNRLAISLQGIRTDEQRLSDIARYRFNKGRAGQLSEAEEYSLALESSQLFVDISARRANITEGVMDRIPALSAGAPAGSRRFDSNTLAAMQFRRINFPRIDRGAVNGGQLAQQNAWFGDFGPPSPVSRTGGLNGSGGNEVTNDLLARILNAIERGQYNSGGGRHPGEAYSGRRVGGGYPPDVPYN